MFDCCSGWVFFWEELFDNFEFFVIFCIFVGVNFFWFLDFFVEDFGFDVFLCYDSGDEEF